MKTLYLCRHAKSDWSTSLPDHERPLNERGLQSVPVMAEVWKQLSEIPTYWISSSAERALRTAQLLAAEAEPDITIHVDHELYLADIKTWLEVITSLPESEESVTLFGHNPGITHAVNYLTGSDIGNIPTCGLVKMSFEVPNWNHISQNTGLLDWFEYPKKHKNL